MKDLKTLLESSILDIEGTIEDGNKYNNVDLEMLMNAKSESEFNLLYDLLKEQIISTQKTPEIVTGAFCHKFIKTKPGEYYIEFYNRKDGNKEFPALLFGNKDTVAVCWHPIRNKLITSWSNIGFANLPDPVYKKEIRQLPKDWSTQIAKLIKKSNYR